MHIILGLLLIGTTRCLSQFHKSSRAFAQIHRTNITLKWATDMKDQSTLFSITTEGPRLEWIAIGFSDHGEFNNSDLCIFRHGELRDYYIKPNFMLEMDFAQDCELVRRTPRGFEFRRRFLTCDPKDYAIEPGSTQMIIAGGYEFTMNFNSRIVDKELHYGKLLEAPLPPQKQERDRFPLRVLADHAAVPPITTTYFCVVKRLPEEILRRKHHVVEVSAVVEKGNENIVHHMVIYLCQSDDQVEYNGDCNDPSKPPQSKSCSHVTGAWSMNEGPVTYPMEAGLPLGGKNGRQYLMVEIHYNNPRHLEGVIDNSGIEFIVTPTLRPFDAAIMELGLLYSDANSIPPGQPAFPITAHCVEDCTKKLPESGINVFASQLHAHLTGRKIWTSHYRKGVKIGEINRDDHYTPHWQHLQDVQPHVAVMPGDVLSTTCVYDTRARAEVTLGGYGIEDEMCVNYLYYYPASEIEVCKSAVDNSTLHNYFSQKYGINRKSTIFKSYTEVEWDDDKSRNLLELFSAGPLNMHCLQSDGTPFPGHRTNWTSVPQPRHTSGPFIKRRDSKECPSLNDL